MIHYVSGNMFEGNYDALVNAVNCVGVMGKGLALQFKNRYPRNYEAYRTLCQTRDFQPGGLHITKFSGDPYIINFATKDHWKNPSQLSYIESGAMRLAKFLKCKPNIRSIAIPKLGCGLGGLRWYDVRQILEKYLSDVETDIYLFGEKG